MSVWEIDADPGSVHVLKGPAEKELEFLALLLVVLVPA